MIEGVLRKVFLLVEQLGLFENTKKLAVTPSILLYDRIDLP
jgi:hypothetical protein